MARLTGNASGMLATLGQGQAAATKFASSVQASNKAAAASAQQVAESATRTGEAAERSAQRQVTAAASTAAAAERSKKQWRDVSTGAVIAGAVMVAAVGVVVKAYADFEKSMSNVKAATHASGDEMSRLRTLAIDAGVNTAYTAKEAAEGIAELAKAGVGVRDILGGGLAGALSLAAAGEMEVAEAAELAATALVTFKLSGDKVPHVADLLAAGANKAQGSVRDLGYAMKMSALVAAQLGIPIEDMVGGLSAFASAGLLGSDAGTSFKTMLMRLTPNSKEAKEKMAELGISAFDAQGNFMGLADLAGNLRDKLGKLSPEARASAMGIMFGTDAVRAANIMFEQGAEGIQAWIDQVNVAGYAAATAAIKQDNLAGDLQKLKGSIDAVFLKSGSGANQVLRDMVQGFTKLVNAIGDVDPRVLGLAVSLAGTMGAALLLTGAGMKLYSAWGRVSEVMARSADGAGKATGALGKVAAAAGVAMVAIAALQIVGAFAKTSDVKTTEDYANALLKVSEAGAKAKASDLDSIFQGWDKNFGADIVTDVNSMSEAVTRFTNQDWHDSLNRNFADPLNSFFGFAKTGIGQVVDRFGEMGDAMGDLVANGGAEAAAKSFSLLTAEFERNGQGAAEALEALPAYKDALLNQAQAASVSLTPTELLTYALSGQSDKIALATSKYGSYTDASGRAVPITEALARALEEIGIDANGTVVQMDKYIDRMQRAGLMTLDARQTQRDYAEALRAVGLNADGAGGKIGSLTGGLSLNTAQGVKNQAALDAVARAGMNTTASMAGATDAFGRNVYSQKQLQANLMATFQNTVRAAGQFGVTGTAADNLARDIMGVPRGVNINTWMSDYAKRMAQQTKGAVDAVPSYKSTTVQIQVYGMEQIEAARASLGNLAANSMIAANAYASGAAYRKWNGGPIRAFADGGFNGPVMGPGTGVSDSILALLSNGEYVMKASAVSKFGLGFMDAVNNGIMPAANPMIALPFGGEGPSGQNVTVNFAPQMTVEVEVPGLGEKLTGRIRSVARDEGAHLVRALSNEAASTRGTTRTVFI